MYYSISAFAKMVNLSAHTLRYYEKEHLLTARRDNNGRRYFGEQEKEWILFIQRLKETGMPLKEIRKYAELRARGDESLQERLTLLERHQQSVAENLARWQENFSNLENKLAFYRNQISRLKLK